MDVLAPIDGSDCSRRALEFAVEFVEAFEATLHVVHFSDAATEATDDIREMAIEILDAHDVDADYELLHDEELDFRPSDRVGRNILELVSSEGYDHVIMGHHGSDTMDRLFLGSAAETVVAEEAVATTIVP